jgi:hypothetical protein
MIHVTASLTLLNIGLSEQKFQHIVTEVGWGFLLGNMATGKNATAKPTNIMQKSLVISGLKSGR